MPAKRATPEELGEMLTDVVKYMATKDDIADLKNEMLDQFERVETQFRNVDELLRDISSQ